MVLVVILSVVLALGDVAVAANCGPDSPQASCEPTPRWRPVDGSCNNIRDATQGMAGTPYTRVLSSNYADGVHDPRGGVTRFPLPSPRRVVTALMPDADVSSPNTNHLVMNWAQLVAHDVGRVKAPVPQPNSTCCREAPSDRCTFIHVPSNDPFYAQHGVNCIGVSRSQSKPCHNAFHDQINTVSHHVDASFVYGSDEATATRLRTGRGGRLRVKLVDGDEFLPDGFEAGDGRVTITPMLAALQTLFLREHNRVAAALSKVNPHWRDEHLYQEARRVVIAQWQLMTYRDWLQWIIGSEAVLNNGLLPSTSGHSGDYSLTVDPSTSNDFSSAAFRAFHSLIQNEVWFGGADEAQNPHASVLLSESSASSIMNPVNLRRVVVGMIYQPMQQQDQFMANEMTNKLFSGDRAFGTDLISIDIMRGREHGVRGYNDYRQQCNMSRASDWNGFRDTISHQNIRILRTLYSHPDDVDFYVGGLLEMRSDSSPTASITSPVFRCVITDQFRRSKTGDAFFFDLKGPHSFSTQQLQAIGKQTFSRLICDNTPGIRHVPNDAFLRIGVLGNREVLCKSLPGINFEPWRESIPLKA